MGFWKAIGKFFGGLFVLLGLTIFIMSYFGSYAIDNVDLIEGNLTVNDEVVDGFVQNHQEEINQVKYYCEQNPNDENCKLLDSPTVMAVLENGGSDEDPILDGIKQEINDFSIYGDMMRLFGVVFFFLGLFFFILSGGWIVGLKDASLVSFVGNLFSYLYYRFAIPGTLNNLLPKEVYDIVGNWVIVSLNQTLNLILILGVTFLILTVGLYILYYKQMKPLGKASAK